MSAKCEAFLASPFKRFLCIRFSCLLITVGFGLLLYYGITVALPSAKARFFYETTCRVNFSTFEGEEVCDCGAGFSLSSCYPCLKIYVVFTTESNQKSAEMPNTRGPTWSVLYKDISSVGDKCTLKPPSCCSRSKEENRRQVWDFMEKNGRNDSWIVCYYDRFNHTEVIATKGNYQLAIFSSLFWPSLVIAIGFLLIKYVKRLPPGKARKTISKAERKRILVLSTLTAFLRSEGQSAASYHSNTVPHSQSHSLI